MSITSFKINKLKVSIVSLFFLCLLFIACQDNESKQSNVSAENVIQLGELDFEVSGQAHAQEAFKKGLLLLHSFEYKDARQAFVKAQQQDSLFLMAYWGEAMTYNHSLWQQQELEKGDSIVQLIKTIQQHHTVEISDLEKDFLESLNYLYGTKTKTERDLAYKEYMKGLVGKYPNNHEVSAFYAISLLGASRNGRDEELYGKSAEIAQGILKENPHHPGALHYLIHSFDDPINAPLAKDAADKYSKVAPDAAHALHMPSHIYVALGQWNNVVNSNIASWNASLSKRKNDESIEGSYHALNWLQYGLLQRNEIDLATELVNRMVAYTEKNPSKKARSYLLAMKGAHMVETDSWSGPIADLTIQVDDLPIIKRTGYAYLEGMKAFAKKDQERLNEIIYEIRNDKYQALLSLGDKTYAMCSSGGFENKPPNQLDVNMVSIMEMQLQAAQLQLKDQDEQAIALLQTASSMDDTLSYSAGPPLIFKPASEAYAEILMAHNSYDRSMLAFQKSLKRNPRRMHSLKGTEKVASALGKETVLKEAKDALKISLEKQERKKII